MPRNHTSLESSLSIPVYNDSMLSLRTDSQKSSLLSAAIRYKSAAPDKKTIAENKLIKSLNELKNIEEVLLLYFSKNLIKKQEN